MSVNLVHQGWELLHVDVTAVVFVYPEESLHCERYPISRRKLVLLI